MNHNFYYVVTDELNGLYHSYVINAKGTENLVCVMEKLKGAKSVNAVSTKKEAERIADAWNKTYKENGTNLI